MTRDELIEELARVAWEHDEVGGRWSDVSGETRQDWLASIAVAIQHLERLVPEAEVAMSRVTIP